MSKFYRLIDDLRDGGRLLLGQPGDDEHEEFYWHVTGGAPLAPRPPVQLLVRLNGQLRDISFTTLGTPVVTERAARVLRQVAPHAVQFFAAEVASAGLALHVLNVTRRVDCLDEERSTFTGYRGPGQFVCVKTLVLDAARIGDQKVFRVANCESVLVVSEEMRDAIRAAGLTGGWFEPVMLSG